MPSRRRAPNRLPQPVALETELLQASSTIGRTCRPARSRPRAVGRQGEVVGRGVLDDGSRHQRDGICPSSRPDWVVCMCDGHGSSDFSAWRGWWCSTRDRRHLLGSCTDAAKLTGQPAREYGPSTMNAPGAGVGKGTPVRGGPLDHVHRLRDKRLRPFHEQLGRDRSSIRVDRLRPARRHRPRWIGPPVPGRIDHAERRLRRVDDPDAAECGVPQRQGARRSGRQGQSRRLRSLPAHWSGLQQRREDDGDRTPHRPGHHQDPVGGVSRLPDVAGRHDRRAEHSRHHRSEPPDRYGPVHLRRLGPERPLHRQAQSQLLAAESPLPRHHPVHTAHRPRFT